MTQHTVLHSASVGYWCVFNSFFSRTNSGTLWLRVKGAIRDFHPDTSFLPLGAESRGKVVETGRPLENVTRRHSSSVGWFFYGSRRKFSNMPSSAALLWQSSCCSNTTCHLYVPDREARRLTFTFWLHFINQIMEWNRNTAYFPGHSRKSKVQQTRSNSLSLL